MVCWIGWLDVVVQWKLMGGRVDKCKNVRQKKTKFQPSILRKERL